MKRKTWAEESAGLNLRPGDMAAIGEVIHMEAQSGVRQEMIPTKPLDPLEKMEANWKLLPPDQKVIALRRLEEIMRKEGPTGP